MMKRMKMPRWRGSKRNFGNRYYFRTLNRQSHADHGNNRILQLDTDLTFLGQVYTPPEFRWPSHLCFDSSTVTGRLLVGSNESLLTSRCTVRNIRQRKPITGVTVVNEKIFVVTEEQSRVAVYDSQSLTASRNINIHNMASPIGLSGCPYNNALYISDGDLECIHRVDLSNDSFTRWEMKEHYAPEGLSVTANHTLLVTVWIRGSYCGVLEYSSQGALREVIFDRSIKCAYHTVQLSSDQFIVCHGIDYLHRVCVVNTEGQIIKSYDEESGEGEGQLWEPYALAIDVKHQHIFVADRDSHNVIVLYHDLTYVGRVPILPDLKFPHRLYFDSSTDRLFVAEGSSGRLLVISPPDYITSTPDTYKPWYTPAVLLSRLLDQRL